MPAPRSSPRLAVGRSPEWDFVTSRPDQLRPLLWKVRRLCIVAGIAAGDQIAHAERVATQRLGGPVSLHSASYAELWLLVGELESA